MRPLRRALILLAPLLWVACAPGPGPAASGDDYRIRWVPLTKLRGSPPSVTVVSANLRVDLPGDGANRWTFRRDLLARVLTGAEADVIGTQEGWVDQVHELVDALPGMVLADAHRDWNPKRLYPSILVKQDRVQILESGDVWLSETPDEPESKLFGALYPRMLTWALLEHRETGHRFLAFNTHLTHLFGFVRSRQAQILVDQVHRFNPRGLPIVVTGDFNEKPEGNVRQILLDGLPELRDPWELLGEGEIHSFHGFGDGTRSGRIDWVLLESCFEPLGMFFLTRAEYDPYSGDVVFPSDHLPIAVKSGLCS